MTTATIVSGREQVMANFAEAFAAQDFYGRQPRTELRAAMEVFLPWLGLAGQRNGQPLAGGRLELRRTYSQIVRGVEGWEPQGTCKANRQKYKKSVDERLDILIRIGWVERFGPIISSSGEGECIAIVLTPAGVAQSVRPAGSGAFKRTSVRGAHPPSPPLVPARRPAAGVTQRGQSRVSKWEIVPPRPEGPSLGSNRPSPCKDSGTAVRADARSLREEWQRHRELTAVTEKARAALACRARRFGTTEPGSLVVAELPWLADVPLASFARIVWGLQPDLRNQPPLLSLRWRQRLESAARRLERYAGGAQPGAAHAAVIDLIRGGWESYRDPADERPWRTFITQTGRRSRPVSLGAIAVCLHRQARQARRDHLLTHDATFESRSNWLVAQQRERPEPQPPARREYRDTHGDPDRFYRELGW